MHFFKSLLAGMALVTLVIAQGLAFTEWPSSVKVGEPVTLKWTGGIADRPAIISLRKGPSDNLDDIGVLTTEAKGGTFEWTPNSNIPEGSDYALQITQGGVINYSGRFSIFGGSGTPSPTWPTAATGSSSGVMVMSASGTLTSSTIAVKPSSTLGTAPNSVPRNGPFHHSTLSPTGHTAFPTSSPTSTKAGKAVPTSKKGGAAPLTRPLAQVLCAVILLVYLN